MGMMGTSVCSASKAAVLRNSRISPVVEKRPSGKMSSSCPRRSASTDSQKKSMPNEKRSTLMAPSIRRHQFRKRLHS